MKTDDIIKNGIHVAILLGLIFALLFLLSFSGVMKCNELPLAGGAWCGVYWSIMGEPRVLIVYGESGLGNPIGGEGSLEQLLENPDILGVHPDTLPIDRVNFGNLINYDIVIVDRAKMIETKQLRAFIRYALEPTGGVLIWTGDAGTQLGPKDAYLLTTDKDPDNDLNEIIGPWSRQEDGYMINFDELLGIRLIDVNKTNFCQLTNCPQGKIINVGNIVTEPSGTHPLIRGISRSLPLYIFKGEDFTVVETLSGSLTNEVLSLDFGTEMDAAGYDLNRSVPLIVTSGIGERIIYYAMPLEYFANPKLREAGKGPYYLPLENMYYGSLKG